MRKYESNCHNVYPENICTHLFGKILNIAFLKLNCLYKCSEMSTAGKPKSAINKYFEGRLMSYE